MSDPYVGEVRMFGFPRIPQGWLACDGSLQPISNYEVLFALIGTTYGGNGSTTFGLPDLRGRTPIHQGTRSGLTTRVLGQTGGQETVTLSTAQIPAHTHSFLASSQTATANTPGSIVTLAAPVQTPASDTPYFTPVSGATAEPMSTNTGGSAGGNLPHDNCAPTLPVNICIAWAGIYPSQS